MRTWVVGCLGLVVASWLLASVTSSAEAESAAAGPLTVVVMDPLAKPLSCPCVAGYAQRDYDKLGTVLAKALGREVKVIYFDSLVAAMKGDGSPRADIVIGKESVVLHDAKTAGLKMSKVAMLTGKDGLTTQRGLVVVPAADAAKGIADLKEHRIYFGPAECDEKHTAAFRLLKEHGVAIPAKPETAVACDEGAIKILEMAAKGERGCAVISSYAKPLLEGCGQVPKGALRVVGETAEVPFVAAYVNADLDSAAQAQLSQALLKSTAANIGLRLALETKRGFVAADESTAENSTPDDSAAEVAKKK
jgi:ABC-type phosphate/phosphonate transport system substrate-binding protein